MYIIFRVVFFQEVFFQTDVFTVTTHIACSILTFTDLPLNYFILLHHVHKTYKSHLNKSMKIETETSSREFPRIHR